MLKKLFAWLKSRLSKGKMEMNDIANVVSTVAVEGKADLESAASAVVNVLATALPEGSQPLTLEAGKIVLTSATSAAGIDSAAAKIKEACDKLGIALPAQWAQVIELVKVL